MNLLLRKVYSRFLIIIALMNGSRFLRLCVLAVLAIAASGQVATPPPAGSPSAKTSVPLGPGTYAYIETSMGRIVCQLLPAEAPKTVANFVGLATGTKGWVDPKTGKERHTPFYNGLTFHRLIKDSMIQGGDPLATGEGGPGFALDDEISANLHFDKPGMLAMAERRFPTAPARNFLLRLLPLRGSKQNIRFWPGCGRARRSR